MVRVANKSCWPFLGLERYLLVSAGIAVDHGGVLYNLLRLRRRR
jgi:hypothetical protein